LDYTFIHKAIIEVYEKCNIHSFPIDCFKLLDEYKLKYHSYSSQTLKKREKCFLASNDAFTIRNVIFYNDEILEGRVRFTLMHELAHRILKHVEPITEENEIEANYFASHILAPRMAIHYSQCKNFTHVAKLFDITNEAAQYAFDDYRRWHRWTVTHRMNISDKAIYNHFYNPALNKFVYKVSKCNKCNIELFNTSACLCDKCSFVSSSILPRMLHNDDFYIAESNWLYGGQ
jgi:hypothetical protein